MTEARKEIKLTAEQQTRIDQFGAIILSNDSEKKLIDIIEDLNHIPWLASPLVVVARNQDHTLIEYFIKIATQRAIADTEKREADDREKFLETGHFTPLTLTDKDYFPWRFIRLIRPIYYSVINGYAAVANVEKVNEMLGNFEKWLSNDNASVANAKAKIATLYSQALAGYDQGGHFEELEKLWQKRKEYHKKNHPEIIATLVLVARYFAKNSKFDDVSQMIGCWRQQDEIKDAAIEGYKLSGNDFEILKINKMKEILAEADKQTPEYYRSKRKEKIFDLIDVIDDPQLKKSLFIDCIYKGTQLGYEMWFKRSSTSTMKRGVLNKIVKKLIEMGVDIAALPGCETYSSSWISAAYPSKAHLVGMWPHSPARDSATHVVTKTKREGDDTDSDEDDDTLMNTVSITDSML